MVLSYLEGGKSLEGVASSSVDVVYNESSLSFSSASSLATYSSINDNQEQHQLILRRLGLSSQGFVHHILKAKSDHQQLWLTKILDASRNQITSIPPALEHFTNLTLLNLCCNNISIIPEAILCLHQLQQLYLSENQIVAIPEAMPMCLTQLVVLNLDSNYIKSLPDSIGQWKNLRELRLGSEYGGNIIEFLPDTVCEMQALVELDLSFNALQNIGILQGLRKLTYLNLSHNRLQYLPLFDDCFQLTTVDISDNLIRTIPYEAANSVLRLMHCELQVLNLSNNRLDIIPTELLDQAKTHVIIHGNPLASHQQQNEGDTDEQGNQDPLPHENNTHQIVQDLIQTAMPMVDYYRNTAGTPDTRNEEPAMQGVHAEQVGGRDQDRRPPYLLHSLREITLRDIAVEDTQLLISKVPEHLAQDIRENLRLCPQCHTPFLHEWVSTPQLKTYQGHRSVVRQIRFCSTTCWMFYKEMLQQEALAAQSEVHLRQQQENALAYIAQHSNVLQPGSFEWVVAASLAATAQDEQADLLANATMMM